MQRDEKKAPSLTLLGGGGVQYPADYEPGVLETFVNRHQENPALSPRGGEIGRAHV